MSYVKSLKQELADLNKPSRHKTERYIMKNTVLVMILLATLVVSCLVLTACQPSDPSSEHSCEFCEWIVIKQPTCTEEGQRERYCSCGEKQTSSLATIGHNYTAVVTDPTCTEQGFTTYTCHCGDSYVDTYVDATGHTKGSVVVENEVDATCTEDGSYDNVVYCTICEAELSRETNTVDALGHDKIKHAAQDPTCTEVGWDAYVTCLHCDYSTYNEIPAAGHSHSAVVTPPTCVEQGFTIHTCACGDSYVDTYVDALGHTWGDWHETKAPTMTEDGEELRYCDNCDCYETNIISSIANGTWGSLTWTLNKVTGELVISGVGEMDDIPYHSSFAWREYNHLIKTVAIENGIISIGANAFSGCYNLTSVTIANGVTSIGIQAFDGCSSLTSIEIPSSMIAIGGSAFRYCNSLTYDTYDNAKYIGNEENPYLVLMAATSTSITTCEINENCTVIYSEAFSGCSRLTSIAIPDGATSIGGNAFYNCSRLTSVTIGNGVTTIDHNAFYGCSGLTSVTIGNSVTTIGDNAFKNCSSLTDVYYTGDIAGWCGITFSNVYANPMRYAGNLSIDGELLLEAVIPSSITQINNYAFYNCDNLISAVIPDSVTSIGNAAFSNCNSLTSIVIPDGVTAIGNNAFCNCTSLTSITIPDSVTSIGEYAFTSCESLTNVTIPDSVTTIGKYAFDGCSSLTSVTFEDPNGWYVTQTEGAANGTSLSLTITLRNVIYFTSTYYDYYWYKNN